MKRLIFMLVCGLFFDNVGMAGDVIVNPGGSIDVVCNADRGSECVQPVAWYTKYEWNKHLVAVHGRVESFCNADGNSTCGGNYREGCVKYSDGFKKCQ